MSEELIYRRDCNLFSESIKWEEIVDNLMRKYELTWDTSSDCFLNENLIYGFAIELLQKAQKVIDSADTIAYENDFTNVQDKMIHYLSYQKEEEEEEEDE